MASKQRHESKAKLPSEQLTYYTLFQVLSRSKYGLERAAFITCQWHFLMKPSFVCLMAPGLHLSLASQCRDMQHSPCQLSFGGGTRSTLPRACTSFCMLWNPCNNTTVKHGLLHSAGWVFLAGRKHATASVPQLPNVARTGSVTYVCCRECGVGVRLCSSTAGVGFSCLS